MRTIAPVFLICALLISSCKPSLDKYKVQNELYEKFIIQHLFRSIKNQKLWLPKSGEYYEKFAEKTDSICNEYFTKSFLVKDFKTSEKDFELLQQKVLEILSIKEAFQSSERDYFLENTKLAKPIESYDDLFAAYLKLKCYSISTIRSRITTCGMFPIIFEIDTLIKNNNLSIRAYNWETRNAEAIKFDILSISQNGQNLDNVARVCNKPSLYSINLPLTNDTSAIQLITLYADEFSDSIKIDTFLFNNKRTYESSFWGHSHKE
jgi:hypothetical protein